MARKKTSEVRASVKAQVSARLKDVRLELFGEHGGPELARRLSLPARTWYNYETGVTVPAEVLLGFIQQTDVDPGWLLTGEGTRYRRHIKEGSLESLSPRELIQRSLDKLEQEEDLASQSASAGSSFLSLDLVAWATLCLRSNLPPKVMGRVLADRRWIAHPNETFATTIEDNAMAPILPMGSVIAIDRAVRDPSALDGRLAAVCVEGQPMVRWLELSERHLILRPNVPSRSHPSIPIELHRRLPEEITGLVVCSWSKFGGD